MDEFIVWDEENERFTDLNEFQNQVFMNCDGKIEWFSHTGMSDADFQFRPLRYIGKTDINDKKIYADCSVVEFLLCNVYFHGVYIFDSVELRYFIKVFKDDTGIVKEPYEIQYSLNIKNLKIIGTLQENKEFLND